MSALRVAVIGASGRMGSFARRLLEEHQGFELAAAFDSEDRWQERLRSSAAEVALEVTVAGRGHVHGLAILEAGVRPVIGTSGVTPEQGQALDRRARELGLGGLVVPNFSLGIALLRRFAREGIRRLPRAEIIELHHDRKADAPSGTAVETARDLSGAGAGEVPIHSVRLPGLFSHQEVLLSGPGETLTLRHDMLGPEAFGPGILAALRYARTARGVGRGLELALGEP